jgi:hypothetical protein
MPLFSPRFRRRVLAVGMNLAVQVAAAEANLLMRGGPPPAPAALHEEAPGRPAAGAPSAGPAAAARGPRRLGHVRRQLRSASTGLGLARLQLRAGLTRDAEATLDRLHQDIQSLRRDLEGPAGRRRDRRPPRLDSLAGAAYPDR